MKNKPFISLLSLCCCAVLFMGNIFLSNKTYAKTQDYITQRTDFESIDTNTVYKLSQPFEFSPNSFSAWIKLPQDFSSEQEGGIIMSNNLNSNYGNGATWVVGTEGKLIFKWKGEEYSHTFSSFDLRTGEWEYISVIRDSAQSKVFFYINGNLQETVNASLLELAPAMPYNIGLDRKQNNQSTPFAGQIKQITVYGTTLSKSQIEQDMQNQNITSATAAAPDLLGNWNNLHLKEYKVLDTSNYSNHAILATVDYLFDYDFVDDSDYTFVVIPDTQYLNLYKPQNFVASMQWINDNSQDLNIKFAMHVGDIQDHGNDTLIQWQNAKTAMSILDGKVPYSLCLGNHDYDAHYATIGSRKASNFNNAFPYSKYSQTQQFGGAYIDGYMDNVYHKFEIGDAKYLIFALEYGPRTDVLLWASQIIENNLDHRVIITTHSYLSPDATLMRGSRSGSPSSSLKGLAANNGDEMWEFFVKKHSNIFMVLSGHETSVDFAYRVDIADKGNKVMQGLVDLQSYGARENAISYLAVMRFNEQSKKMYMYWYNPIENKFLNIQNQFVYDFSDQLNPAIDGTLPKDKQPKSNIVVPIIIAAASVCLLGAAVFVIAKKLRKTKI